MTKESQKTRLAVFCSQKTLLRLTKAKKTGARPVFLSSRFCAPGKIRTSEDLRSADLQSALVDHLSTDAFTFFDYTGYLFIFQSLNNMIK